MEMIQGHALISAMTEQDWRYADWLGAWKLGGACPILGLRTGLRGRAMTYLQLHMFAAHYPKMLVRGDVVKVAQS